MQTKYLLSQKKKKTKNDKRVKRGEEFVSGLIETYDDQVGTSCREIERGREGVKKKKKKKKCNYRASEEWPPRTNGRGGGGAFWPDAPVLRVSLEIQGFDINAEPSVDEGGGQSERPAKTCFVQVGPCKPRRQRVGFETMARHDRTWNTYKGT